MQTQRSLRASPRQRELLLLLSLGLTDAAIALKLGLSMPTVRTHLSRLYRANRLHNRTEAVAAWLESKGST